MKNLVLTFHNVIDSNWFERTLELISKFYDFGSLDELYDRLTQITSSPKSKKMCYITFDDGERSVYEIVYPIIKKLNIPITIFVSPKNILEGGSFWFQRMRMLAPSRVEDMKRLSLASIMSEIEILDPSSKTDLNSNITLPMFREMQHSNLVTFGAHTLNHPILANESKEIVHSEISKSIKGLESLLGTHVNYFAYPNGRFVDFTNECIEYLKDAHIYMAFTMEPGFVKAHDMDMYRINRVGLTSGGKLHILCKILFPQLIDNYRKLMLKIS